MTREEALKRMKWTKGRTGITSEEAEAIGYAIEKLSNSDEDCISRKTVNTLIDELARAISDERCCISRGRYTATIMQEILDLPSIQPKPKTDEPIQVELEGDGYADNGQIYYDYGKCPKCGWDFEYGDKDWEEPYCCHCGQKLHWFESEEEG